MAKFQKTNHKKEAVQPKEQGEIFRYVLLHLSSVSRVPLYSFQTKTKNALFSTFFLNNKMFLKKLFLLSKKLFSF